MKGKCFECESYGEIDNHHVVPKSLGGTKTIPLCYKCHGLVHNKDFVKHRALLLKGVAKAKTEGKFKGRKKGSIKSDEKLLKEKKSLDIIKLYKENMSYRKISNILGVSSTTICKVIAAYKIAVFA